MDVIYLFSTARRVRGAITQGISSLIHSEHDYTLRAEIPCAWAAMPGEYIGFACADGRFRLFEIDDIDEDETTQTATCICTDAAVGELRATVVRGISLTAATPGAAAEAILAETDFTVHAATEGIYPTDVKVFTGDAWSALKDVAYNCDVRIIPSYEFADGDIAGRRVDIEAKQSTFCGRVVENGVDASRVSITRSGSPRPMVYGLGATDENDEQLTFADVEWSVANGDPVDKPKGQVWVGVPEAVEAYPGKGQIYELVNCTDAGQLLALTWKQAKKAAAPAIGAEAIVSDMALMPGQSWRTLRLYDRMAVITKRGEAVAKVIIELDRNYVRPDETKIVLGEEDERPPNIAREVAKLETATLKAGRGGGGAGAAAKRNYYLLSMQEAEVDEIKTKVSTVYVELDAINSRLTLKAEKVDLEREVGRITEAEIRLDAADAAILLKANATDVDELGNRVSAAEIEIDGLNSEITLKADKVTIDAELTAIRKYFAGEATIAKAVVTNLTALAMTFDGLPCAWQYVQIPTAARMPALVGYNVRLGDDSTAVIYAFSDNSRTVSLTMSGVTVMKSNA